MKKFISILLIMTLLFATFTTASISAFAEESSGEENNTETTPEQGGETEDTTPEGDGTTEETQPEGDNEGTATGETDLIANFLASFIPVEALGRLKDALFSFVERLWDFIMSDETYSNVATAVLAVLGILAIPVVVGVVVVIYGIIGGMIIVAGALTAVVELFLGMIGNVRIQFN